MVGGEGASVGGSLVCAGVGMTLGSHLTPLARSEIEGADVIFVAVSDAMVERWVASMHPDVRSLQPLYAEGKPRTETYAHMVDAILAEVRAGRRVCAVFYGHPGIFVSASHACIRQALAEGYPAHMEPGISASDCLYADLGIDPGGVGCQHYEATQFLLHERRIDAAAWLILWQVGLVGDLSLGRRETGAAYRQVLVDVLCRDFPEGHEVILYRAPILPLEGPHIVRLPLHALPAADFGTGYTLAVPPCASLRVAPDILARLRALSFDAGA